MKLTGIVLPSGNGWYALYNFFLTLSIPAIFLLLLANKRSRAGLLERFGVFSRDVSVASRNKLIVWIHAVSMGEAMAIVPLVLRIKETYPDSKIFVSTTTTTGRDVVLDKLSGIVEHLYFPLDHKAIVNRVLNRIQPRLFMIVDTELWPNLLHELSKRQIPTALINGRLSRRSYRGYMRIRPFMKHVIQAISLCAMQSHQDVERIQALGAKPERVLMTGNVKCDHKRPLANSQSETSLRMFIHSTGCNTLLVAASTHKGEENILLKVYKHLIKEFPSLGLLLAPRHLHRVPEVEAMTRSHGFVPVRKTIVVGDGQNGVGYSEDPVIKVDCSKRVLILDTYGELPRVFQFATIVWVGGSWVPVGGHNIMEPAQWGKPVFFGPYMDHLSEMAEIMVASGGGVQTSSFNEMTDRMAELLRDEVQRRKMGRAALQVVIDHQGALDRTLQAIYSLIPKQF